MKQQTNYQTGDIFLIRGNNWLSRWIRFLVFLRYGIPYRQAYSHIESAFNSRINISAESSGVGLVKNTRFDLATDYRVYRLKKMDSKKQANHKKIAEKYIGKGYAYARYLLDTTRIGAFYVSLAILLFGFLGFIFASSLSQSIAMAAGGIFVLLTIIKPFLIRKDILTHDCTELQSLIFSENDLWVPLTDSRNEFPQGMMQVLDNMVLNGQAQLIFKKESMTPHDEIEEF